MSRLRAIVAVLLSSHLFFADAGEISLSGKAIDKETSAGIAGVNISMKNKGLSTISGSDGSFSIKSTVALNTIDHTQPTNLFSIKNNVLVFSSLVSADVSSRVELFSINGKKIACLKTDNLSNDHYGVVLPELSPGITCIRLSTENLLYTGSLFSIGKNITLKGGKLTLKSKGNPQYTKETKITAQEIDTLVASKNGYLTQIFPLESSNLENIEIKMEKSPAISNNTDISLLTDKIEVSGSGATVNGTEVTITSSGTYNIRGKLTNGQIVVNAENDGNVILILDGVEIGNSSTSPLFVQNAKTTIIELADGSDNTFSDASTYTGFYEDDEPNATIFSKDDLIFRGNGKLTVNGNYGDAIVSKDGLLISGGNFIINSVDDGIRGKDKLIIRGGTIDITAKGDGLTSTDSGNASTGYVQIEDGDIKINADKDGIQAANYVEISGGKIDITTGGGSEKNVSGNVSAKGIKAENKLLFTGGTFTINSADDGIHSDGFITFKGGVFTISTADDGVHAESTLVIDSGEINVIKSYEGLEASAITINGGKSVIVGSDDAINVAGGSSSSSGGGGRWGPGGVNNSPSHLLQINGGYLAVYSGGDGLDANGNIEINGGITIVHGPEKGMNGVFDIGDGSGYYMVVNGGFLLAAGTADMAITPSTNSKQNCLIARLTSSQSAGTLINLQNSNGEILFTFSPAYKYQWVAFSSPDLINGTYNYYYGGSVSGGIKEDGLYEGEKYTPGTSISSNLSVSSRITTVGGSGGGGRW
ncbi:MAG: carbohydrate-binding domain-containing protein [Fibrobacter sp.]|jgi:hypothetical protein|nr:carbohydrate-binding domain-containing protein [Fibrobacter sp.]